MNMKQEDSKKKEKACAAPCASPVPGQPADGSGNDKGSGKETVPGQQIGLYGKAGRKDVRQMVKMLNPGKHSMESRG